MKSELIYLASPYSHSDISIVNRRYEEVTKVAAKMMKEGKIVFSPITHNHPIVSLNDTPRGWEYWEKYDTVLLSKCDRLVVLQSEGWSSSKGVQAEIRIARNLKIPVDYLDNNGNPIT